MSEVLLCITATQPLFPSSFVFQFSMHFVYERPLASKQ